ncbi:MAG: hypothetical protein LBI91_01420 [Spirochaetaceae bacterium]|jgi:hypothetical protein|nr:hypothetical protein [Spirochaetaceae bacterium]
MNNAVNFRKTVKVFLTGILSLLSLWFLAARGLKLQRALASSLAYQDRIAALEPADPARRAELAAYLASIREYSPAPQPPDSPESGGSGESPESTEGGPEIGIAALRELLRAAGIRGERLRLDGKEGNESAELTLRCETVNFFGFLSKLSGRGRCPVNYLSVRPVPGSPYSDIVMRFRYE